jgi:hypothetical protein
MVVVGNDRVNVFDGNFLNFAVNFIFSNIKVQSALIVGKFLFDKLGDGLLNGFFP